MLPPAAGANPEGGGTAKSVLVCAAAYLAAALALVLVRGARLTLNWAFGWRGLSHEDWRYGSYRAGGPLRYWVTSFFGFHVFPAAMTMRGLLPLRRER